MLALHTAIRRELISADNEQFSEEGSKSHGIEVPSNWILEFCHRLSSDRADGVLYPIRRRCHDNVIGLLAGHRLPSMVDIL